MWKLSPELEKVADEWHRLLRIGSWAADSSQTQSLVDRLVASNFPVAIPVVASGLFRWSWSLHRQASGGIAKLLRNTPSTDLNMLGGLIRDSYSSFISERWYRLSPTEVRIYLWYSRDLPVACLLSLHENGRVRQAAIRFLQSVDSGEELRFLLVRQNDWVPEIAKQAQQAVQRKLTPEYVSHFLDESEQIVRMLGCERQDLSGTWERLIELLMQPNHRTEMVRGIQSLEKRSSRMLVRHLLAREGDHLVPAIRAGLESEDGIIRSNCIRDATSVLPRSECETAADRLMNDNMPMVRIEAREAKCRLVPSTSVAVWTEALFDRSRIVRSNAIYFLQQAECDVASLCRRKLSEAPDSLPALSALVACGDASDRNVFRSFLNSPKVTRRVQAIRGLGRVGDEADIGSLVNCLFDAHKRVVRTACQQLLPFAESLDAESLFRRIDQCPSPSGVQAIFQLLVARGRWEAMPLLISGLVHRVPDVAGFASFFLNFTLTHHRVFTKPNSRQRKSIQETIDACRHAFDELQLRELSFGLSVYGFKFD